MCPILKKKKFGKYNVGRVNSNLSMLCDVGSVTGDCESCQNGISALTTCVNGGDFALDLGNDLHELQAK